MLVETPHIKADSNDFGKTVLMPGDPLRSKYIADTYLENPKLVNNIRGVQGYTGTYKGIKVSVMASGMGMPSMGIYSYELYKFFNVKNIIRIGSAGSISKSLKIKDIIIGEHTISNSNYNNELEKNGISKQTATLKLVEDADEIAEKLGYNYKVGTLYSSDTFYDDNNNNKKFMDMGASAVEMEANALYINAKKLHKNCIAICTISDSILTGEECSPEDRQTGFTNMMTLALELALKEEK